MSVLKQNSSLNRNLISKVLVSIIGNIIIGMGIGVFLYADMGTDPCSAFVDAVSKNSGLGFGISLVLVHSAVTIFILLLDKKYINISTLIALSLVGYSAQLFLYLLKHIYHDFLPFYFQLLLAASGVIIMSLGVSIYMSPDLGASSIDALPEVLSNLSGLSYYKIRIFVDSSFLISAWIFGGALGLGTFMCAFLLGPAISFFRPLRIRLNCLLQQKN